MAELTQEEITKLQEENELLKKKIAESKTDRIKELEKENESLKKRNNPLTEKEQLRLTELQGLCASLSSSNPKYDPKDPKSEKINPEFTKAVTEFAELKSRYRNGRVSAYANVGDSIKIGE